MLAQGIAREMARMVLPVNIYTEIYACWDLKNLLHFITLREDSHAQAEIQEYGKAIKLICQDKFPLVMEAYEKYKWVVFES
jgi:thymidylate synthase (FAD)